MTPTEELERLADPVGCVNTIPLQTGQIWTTDGFTHPTGSAKPREPVDFREFLYSVGELPPPGCIAS